MPTCNHARSRRVVGKETQKYNAMEITVNGLPDLPAAVARVREQYPEVRVFLLHGDLGAGKTTFVQAFCRSIGVQDDVSSPTFALVNEYERTTAGGPEPVYHLDLYRLKDLEEALDMGLEEYLESGYYCFVEWPDVADGLYPENRITLQLETLSENTRKILFL